MASSTFRDSINSLGWTRRNPDIPVNTSKQSSGLLSSIQSLNPFGDRGYVRLPTTEGAGAPLPAPTRREEEEGWFVCRLINLFPIFQASITVPSSVFPLHRVSSLYMRTSIVSLASSLLRLARL
jgi:hypothetical protein